MTKDDPLICSFTKDGPARFNPLTADEYVRDLKVMVTLLKKAQEQLRQIEIRVDCLRNEIEDISPRLPID